MYFYRKYILKFKFIQLLTIYNINGAGCKTVPLILQVLNIISKPPRQGITLATNYNLSHHWKFSFTSET